jgi:protein gp37
MGDRSSIEWTDASWNPWRGCDKVSPGCAHCYMFRDQERYGRDPGTVTRCSPGVFHAPHNARRWAEQRLAIEREQNRRMRVFTCSWSDFFHPDADEWRDEAWSLIRNCPQYDWQILTKRPELIADRLPKEWGEGWPHVWLGVSIENRRFVHRADLLRQTPAAVRFISAEPLLGPLINECPICHGGGHCSYCAGLPGLDLAGIDWLIVGGESGSRHRPMHEEWALQLLDACGAPDGDPAFFFKQWGGAKPTSGGRELDGRTWSEFPAATSPSNPKGEPQCLGI